MKRNGLIIAQALLFAGVMIFFGIVIVNEKLPTILISNAEKKISNYFEEKFSDLDFRQSDIKYNETEKKYSITYYNKEHENLNFTISYKLGEISDNYKENYVEGKEVIEAVRKKVQDKYDIAFKNSVFEDITVEFLDLSKYSDDAVNDILNDNIYDTAHYTLSFYVNVKSENFDDVYLNNLVNSFNEIASNNGLYPNGYSITFDNNGIIKVVNLENGGKRYE